MENIVEVKASINVIDNLKNILKAFLHFCSVENAKKEWLACESCNPAQTQLLDSERKETS